MIVRLFFKLTCLFFVVFTYVSFIFNVYVLRTGELHKTYYAAVERNDFLASRAVVAPSDDANNGSSPQVAQQSSFVVPYVFNATLLSSLEITLATSAYVDELARLEALADVWHGPISVALCMPMATRDIDRSTVTRFVSEHSGMQRNVDVHFVETNDAACSFAALRNAAVELARTEWTLALSNRMLPNGNAHISLLRSIRNYFAIQQQQQQQQYDSTPPSERRVAFVLPAFASSTLLDARDFPPSKRELTRSVRLGTLDRLDETQCIQCQEPLDVERWFVTRRHYSIKYKWLFEPIVVLRRALAPAYRVVVALQSESVSRKLYALQLALLGYEFVVLPDSFIVQLALDRRPIEIEREGSDKARLQLYCSYLKNETSSMKVSNCTVVTNGGFENHCIRTPGKQMTAIKPFGLPVNVDELSQQRCVIGGESVLFGSIPKTWKQSSLH